LRLPSASGKIHIPPSPVFPCLPSHRIRLLVTSCCSSAR
jgi:hypothetical protein